MHLPSHHHLQTPYQKIIRVDFPSGPVVKAAHYQCRGVQVQSLIRDVKSHLLCETAKFFLKNSYLFYFLRGEETQNLIKNQGNCYNEPNI